MLGQVHHPDLGVGAGRIAGEIDDDIIALGDALLVELGKGHGARQQIAVVGDLDHRRAVTQCDLVEAGHGAIEDAEAVLARLHLEVGLVAEVHGHDIAQEAVGLKDVEKELTMRVEILVGQRGKRTPGSEDRVIPGGVALKELDPPLQESFT